MTWIIAAITLMIATPGFAQSAAPANVYTQHSSQAGKAGHEGLDMSDGRCAKVVEGKVGCYEKMKAESKAMSPPEAPAADPHAGHGASQQ